MKQLVLLSTLFLALPAMAADYAVPLGFYSGNGTWSDNSGQKGTWTMTLNLSQDAKGKHEEFISQFSDGRQYSGSSDIVFGNNSNFTYVAQVGGSAMTIGHGVSSPGAYQVTDLMLNANESIMEFGDFSHPGVLRRAGSIFDKSNGRSTQYEIKEMRLDSAR